MKISSNLNKKINTYFIYKIKKGIPTEQKSKNE